MEIRRWGVVFLKLSIAVGLFTWLLKSERLDLSLLTKAPFNALHLLGMAVLLGSMVIQVIRWKWFLEAHGINLSFRDAARLSWISGFFSLFLPGAAGGDIVRGYYIFRITDNSRLQGISTIFADRLIGIFSLLCIGGLSSVAFLITRNSDRRLPIGKMALTNILLLTGATALLICLRFAKSWDIMNAISLGRFGRLWKETTGVYHGGLLAKSLLISMAGNILDTLSYVIASYAIETPISLTQAFIAGPLVTMANILPLAPGGAGLGEATASVLFLQLGTESGALIMLLTRIWSAVLRFPGALFYIAATAIK
ncbi:MAG: lysylphosphatidylglycerol synthase transmembrane domain-containing protein [Deltaproteobacteria bacterium]|nr:lysylphosphatidylglycerol synthase transmembrane domain-containing protein [Deltaproteobacteria bacterium]